MLFPPLHLPLPPPQPLRNNIIPKHIILDTATIISLFCPANNKEGTKKGEMHKNIKLYPHDVWNNLLSILFMIPFGLGLPGAIPLLVIFLI